MAPTAHPKVKVTQLFVNNEWVNSVSGETFATINPATGEKIADVQCADKADVDKAVVAARKAFAPGSPWRTMDASARGQLLFKLGQLLQRDLEYLSNLESVDSGKTYKGVCAMDLPACVSRCDYMGGWADKITGQTIPVDGSYFCYTRREPVGVVGAILPWNAPLLMFFQKLAPALACGCTIIVKPAEQTPLTALAVTELIKEAGFPAGVVNVVPGFGPGAGAALASHNDINKITFTGSTLVGKKIQEAASKSNLKRVTLELGGKSPNVIFADADLDNAAMFAGPVGVFACAGQVCCSGTRTYVQEDIYDKFLEKAVQMAKAKREEVGDPLKETTFYGPQINESQLTRIMSLVETGKKEGARLLQGGKRIGDKGFFFEPTVFPDVTDDMTIAQEEIFGPVQSILKFKTLEEVLPRANNTKYGLAACVFTRDIDKALTFANRVEAGVVWVNNIYGGGAQAPFGGYKQSGIGREMGSSGLEPYLEVKTVIVKVPEKNS